MTVSYIRCGEALVCHDARNATTNNYGWRAAYMWCDGRRRWVFPNSNHACDDSKLTINMTYSTMIVKCMNWAINTSVKSVYDSVSGAKRRLDVRVAGREKAHGILGQNLQNPRNGELDVYPASGTYVTRAQAAGAIEGLASDYLVPEHFSPKFAHSRFDEVRGLPVPLAEASSMDRDIYFRT